LKVLVEELHSASGTGQDLDQATVEGLQDEESGDEEEWEDDEDVLDLGLGMTKKGKYISPCASSETLY
jgi:hypothetical protein